MKPPISFVYGNCVFAPGLGDGWVAFVVETSSYAWLSEDGKRARLLAMLGALEAVEADIQIMRVSVSWPVESYLEELQHEGAPKPHARDRARYLEEQVDRLKEIDASRPLVFLLVSLRDPELDVASYVSKAAAQSPRDWWEGIRRALSLRDRRVMALADLERARVKADQVHARLGDFLSVRPARGVELQWLVRRAFCRGLPEPTVDGLHMPAALVFERNGQAMLAPLEGDVMRWGSLVPFRWFLSRPTSWLYGWDSQQSVMLRASALAGI